MGSLKTSITRNKVNTFLSVAVLSAMPLASQANTPLDWQSKGWELVWQDEFNTGKLDFNNWSIETNCWGGGNKEQQCYTDQDKNFVFEDGILNIVAIKEDYTGYAQLPSWDDFDPEKKATLPFTSGRIISKDKADFKYGRMEARVKMPKGQGTWAAFWMLPTDNVYGGWAASGEIDILEAVNLHAQSDSPRAKPGDPEVKVHGTLHHGGGWPMNVHSGTSYTIPDGVSPAESFNNYAVEWEEGEIRWYVNDVHYATQRAEGWHSWYKDKNGEKQEVGGNAPFDQPFHLIFNFAVGGTWPEDTNEKGLDKTGFPKNFSIDWVRVYQCSKDKETGKGCGSISPDAKLVTLGGH